jgi:iron complex outermembrane receptor protein
MGLGLDSRKIRVLAGISTLALTGAWGLAANAQDAGAPSADRTARAASAAAPVATADDGSIQEVVVYARKRSETAIEAPLAVTAMGQQQVREQSIVSFQDLNRAAPNVVLRVSNSGGGSVDAIIRGQSYATSNIANDPPVGIYFDDVIAAQNKGAGAGIFDIQSIEVARGVQGTLKGRNNTGGAISIYTHRPDLGKYEGEVSATYGSRNYFQGEGILNVPLQDWGALRFAFQRISQDPQGHSTWTGQGFGGKDQWIGRVSALVQPNDNFSWLTTYERTQIDQDPVGRRSLRSGATYDALVSGTRSAVNTSGLRLTPDQIVPSNFYDGSANYLMANDYAKVDFLRSTLSYRFSDALNFKVVAGYRELRSYGGIDLDASPALNLESVNGGTSHQVTVEPQLSGELMGGRVNYVVGYYHFFDRGQLVADTFAYALNAANPTTPFRNHIFIREGATNESNAGYAHLEFKATDRLELAGGLRYTKDERRVRPLRELINAEPSASTFGLYSSGILQPVGCLFTMPINGVLRPAGGFVLLGGNAVGSGACPDIELSKNFGFWSYELSAKYKLTDNVNVYARHGLGQKSGGINVPIASTVTAPFDPEKVRDYEVGVKAARLLDGRLDGSLALYYSDYKGLQRYISTLLPGGGGIGSAIINAGSARIQGVEADFNFRVTHAFRINGFLGYTDAKYKEFITFDANGNPVDLSDQPFVSAPKWTSRLAAVYETPLAGGTLTLTAGWNHQSNSSLQAISYPGAESGKVDLVDARIAWLSPDESLEVAAYGTNLTDDHYFTAATVNRTGVSTLPSSATAAYGNQGEKRFFGVSVRKRWP